MTPIVYKRQRFEQNQKFAISRFTMLWEIYDMIRIEALAGKEKLTYECSLIDTKVETRITHVEIIIRELNVLGYDAWFDQSKNNLDISWAKCDIIRVVCVPRLYFNQIPYITAYEAHCMCYDPVLDNERDLMCHINNQIAKYSVGGEAEFKITINTTREDVLNNVIDTYTDEGYSIGVTHNFENKTNCYILTIS